MATTARFLMESTFSLSCDSANVLEGAVLVQGASNDTCALPSVASSREAILGLAVSAGLTSANGQMTIAAPGCVFPGIAAGTITRGDVLVVGGATGTVVAVSQTTPPDATRVGVAMESAVSGSRVAILIGADSPPRGAVVPFVANGAITANTIVVASTSSRAAAPGSADPTSGVLGVALNTVADAATVYVVVSGVANVTDSGSGVTAGNNIAVAGTGGTGKTAAPSAGANTMCVGTALATVAASGTIPVLVNPFVMQGA